MVKRFTSGNAFLCFLVMGMALTSACKKSSTAPEDTTPVETNNLQTVTTNRDLLTKDSIFLYAKQTYFWNVGMPSYDNFNPRRYATNNAVIAALAALPSTGGKDKYSFIDEGGVAGQLSGVSGDYGFSAVYDPNNLLRVKFVYPGSPADLQGLKRGYQIKKINGGGTDRGSQADIDNINNGIFGTNPSISMTVVKGDGSTADVVINRATYNINPILFSKTYTVGAKKIGYIVFNSFTTNATPCWMRHLRSLPLMELPNLLWI